MKTFKIALTTVFILAILAVQANSREYGDSRMILGAGSGPLIGQVLGRGGDATLVGTEVVDMLGNTGDKEKDRDGYGKTDGFVQPVFFIPPVPRPVFPHQSDIICREFIVTEGRHGNFREVTKTVCRDRNGRHVDRHHWRDDDRRYWGDDDRHDWRDDRWRDRRGDRGDRNRW